MVLFTSLLISAFIADSVMAVGLERQSPQDEIKRTPNITPSGAIGVDQDLFEYHYLDTNQFGGDEAYNTENLCSVNGVRDPFHKRR